ncbi:major facilitator superfamily domain-containing protein [Aspergillus germanicus]
MHANPTRPETDVRLIAQDDPTNPANFSRLRKYHIVLAGTIFTFNSALGSSLPSSASTEIASAFGLTGEDTLLVLLNSLYLVGFALGPLIFGPLSEHLGRQPVLIGTYIGYTFFTMACALAPTYSALLMLRLLCGIHAAAPNAVLGGLYSDIYNDPPIIYGFAARVSWRWVLWVALIIAGAGFPVVAFLPETYGPVLLKRSKRGEDGNTKRSSASMASVFTRPFTMTVREPILLLTSLYLALVYGVWYLFFQAYPVVFQGLYGMSAGVGGLTFIPTEIDMLLVMIGAVIAFCVFMWYSSFHNRALAAGQTWAMVEEHRRLPLACLGAPAIVVSLFWLGWTSYSFIHPIVPMIAGLFFAVGLLLIFIAMINYLTDTYQQSSASVQAAASTIRSITAVCSPLATGSMYGNLGIHWASSLLAFIALGMAVIPFAFIKCGAWLRRKSRYSARIE